MNLPRLYPILDTASLAERGVSLETAAAAFLEGGAGILQIRHKMHWSRDVFESARQVARLCREAGALSLHGLCGSRPLLGQSNSGRDLSASEFVIGWRIVRHRDSWL
jgi:hypothetical protein